MISKACEIGGAVCVCVKQSLYRRQNRLIFRALFGEGIGAMAELSGPQWCARFPGSTSIDDLHPEWRRGVWAFVDALRSGGATVAVPETVRPVERAYLMHWCWMIANLSQAPGAVPPLEGVDIDWTHHGDGRAARAAAEAMVNGFGLQDLPSLDSRHITGHALDMHITWGNRLSLRDNHGSTHYILTEPRNGSNPELVKIAASFGLIRQADGRPHWSVDGH